MLSISRSAHARLGWALNAMTIVLGREGERQTYQRRESWEDEGRTWSDASTSQGTPVVAGSCQKLREKHGTDPPIEPPEGRNFANTLTSDFWAPELWENFCFMPSSLWQFITVALRN